MPIFRYNEQPGNYYAYLIESSGDDLNDGLTPETAVATLDRLVEILDTYAGAYRRHAVIVKKRIYNEGITYARSKPITFEFVGGCEIDGSADNYPQFIHDDELIYANCIDYDKPIQITGITYYPHIKFQFSKAINVLFEGATVNIIATNSYFGNIIIYDVGTSRGWTVNIQKSVINGVTITRNTNASTGANRMSYSLKNNIIINSPNLRFSSAFSGAYFDYNCLVGTMILNGVASNHDAFKTAGYNLNGISANPQFTDPTNGQYTVNQSSPCLYRGEGGEHIGIGEGFYLQANILYFQQSVINNFQLTTGRLGFIDPLDNAFIETNPIDIGQIITLEKAELAAILPVVAGEFTAGPVNYSHWYPAYSAASTYHKGAGVTDSAILYRSLIDNNLNNTPASSATEWERLTWESGVSYAAGKIVQYTDDKWYKANTATSTSWVAGEWDEVVIIREWNLQVKTGRTYDECDAADWATIPYNTTPYLDLAGKGNSDDDYDTSTGEVMVFRFIAVRIDAKTIV